MQLAAAVTRGGMSHKMGTANKRVVNSGNCAGANETRQAATVSAIISKHLLFAQIFSLQTQT